MIYNSVIWELGSHCGRKLISISILFFSLFDGNSISFFFFSNSFLNKALVFWHVGDRQQNHHWHKPMGIIYIKMCFYIKKNQHPFVESLIRSIVLFKYNFPVTFIRNSLKKHSSDRNLLIPWNSPLLIARQPRNEDDKTGDRWDSHQIMLIQN